MRTTRHIPETIVLAITFQLLAGASAFAQNKSKAEAQTFSPLPELLLNEAGTRIETSGQWEASRRDEVLELFREHVYGRVPETALSIGFEEKFLDREALDGTAVMKEVEVQVSNGMKNHAFTILIFLPAEAAGPVPMFVGLNFYGNQSIHSDNHITITNSWILNNTELGITGNQASESTRGVRAGRWPVELILSRGFGVATICCGEIDPDFDDGFKNGVHELYPEDGDGRKQDAWGTIGTWAWGLSRAMDYFETDPEIDQQRVAVIGHSRLGKTSLWAGAQDQRFALVISNNSGCGGAALSRRAVGERVSAINTVFPHWFAPRFREYNDNEKALPVDQHMLLALMAPRPLYVASAAEDEWADPYGEYLSLYYGSRAYGLYGLEVLKEDQSPLLDQPRWTGNVGYHIRTGKHDLTRYDWEQYLAFAEKHMESRGKHGFGNPVTEQWIREHLSGTSPRLILTPDLEKRIHDQVGAQDHVTVLGLQLLNQAAASILDLDPLVYNKTGRRLLGVSREAIRRLTTLAMAFRFEKDDRYLKKLEEELMAVCGFADWNPSHFLDVAEMSAGIALALDWAGEWLSPEVDQAARQSIIEKALRPGLGDASSNSWINAHHNWNLVCHGGLSLGALAVFEDEPGLAAMILHQAVEKIPLALEPYGPDGIYPEGPSYWFYATTYLTAAISAFESALGTGFGFGDAPGVMKSAVFSQVTAGPSGEYYNYFDAGLDGFQSLVHFGLLSWFAGRSGSGMNWSAYKVLLEKELEQPGQIRGTRFFSTHFLNSSLPDRQNETVFELPGMWYGSGDEPIGIFRDGGKGSFFLAAKGGRAADNHGNMDAGSFVFELDGVRWAVDPGNQGYHELEQLMGNELWSSAQDSRRWSLLTKNNFGHSTLTVNNALHLANARAILTQADRRTGQPSFAFDLTPLFGDNLLKAKRSFQRYSGQGLRVEDNLVFSPGTRLLTWQLVTQAGVDVQKDRIELLQDGKVLHLYVRGDVPYEVKVVSLSPPPLAYDKDLVGLKRIEIRVERNAFPGNSGNLVVDLTAL